jgi:hypothetical protein
VQRELELHELIERWTLVGEELDRARGKRGVNALAFALLLKFVIAYGRFPRGRSEIPDEAVEFLARQVGVPAGELGFYDWSGRTIERAEIRGLLDYQECSLTDQAVVTDWLVESVIQVERRPEQVRGRCWRGVGNVVGSRRHWAGLIGSCIRPWTGARNCWSSGSRRCCRRRFGHS